MRAATYYPWNVAAAAIRCLCILAAPLVLGTAAQGADFDFAHRVVPILKQHCVECHGGNRSEGDFSINTRESILEYGAVEPGNAGGSHFIDIVTIDDAEVRMPKDAPPLSESEIDTLREWINAGMPWEVGFTFALKTYEPPLRPERPDLPPAADGRTNPIDRILDAYLRDRNIAPAKPLDDATFCRRVHLDLIGLLPTPEELAAFLSDDDPNKRERLVDSLLANRQAYAEHWLTFWNDLLRNDYQGTGYIDGGRQPISAWLYRSLLENKPYNQFVRELIAPSPESEGFIRGIKWRGNVNASQKQEVQFAQSVSQVFLGINMKCASCHDSFIDRWTLAETYSLAAITADGPLEMYRCDKPIGQTARAAWMFEELGQIDPDAPRDERLRKLAELMTHPENGRTTRTIVNRLWHRLMGRGIVHPVDAMQTEPWNADLLSFLAVDLVDNGYDLKRTLRLVATSQAYQSEAIVLDEEPAAADFVYRGPIAKRMTAEQFVDAIWQMTESGPSEPHKKAADFLPPSDASGRTWYRASLVGSDLLMRSLGRPNREQVASDRPAMLTTLQALDLFNSPVMTEILQQGASQLQKQLAGQDSATIADSLFKFALSRPPTSDEQAAAVALLGTSVIREGIEDLLWVVVMLPEFQIIR